MFVANIHDYRRLAQKRLPRFLFEYIDGGAFSSQVADLAPETPVRLRGPYGDSYLRDGDRPILLCAIGSGIAPSPPAARSSSA